MTKSSREVRLTWARSASEGAFFEVEEESMFGSANGRWWYRVCLVDEEGDDAV